MTDETKPSLLCHRCGHPHAICNCKEPAANYLKVTHERFKSKASIPVYWPRKVQAAYLFGTGLNGRAVAKEVGVDPATISRWVHSEWWHLAEHDAESVWRYNAVAKVRNVLLEELDDKEKRGQMARYLADRLVPELAPPKQRSDVNIEHPFLGVIRKSQDGPALPAHDESETEDE